MKTITMLFILGLSTNVFSQDLQTSRPMEFEEQFFEGQDYVLSNEEVWFAAHLALEEIKDYLESGEISEEQAKQAVTMVLQTAGKMTKTGLIKVSNHSELAKHMLGGCIALGFTGAGIGAAMGPAGSLAGGITGCFFGISVGVFLN